MILDLEALAMHGFALDGVVTAELVPARADYPRHQANPTCPVCGMEEGLSLGVLYLRTATGTLGSGAHPGSVHRCHTRCVDWVDTGVHTGTRRDVDDQPVCEECLTTLGDWEPEDYPELPPVAQAPCWSCAEMLRAQEDDAVRVWRTRNVQ